ncbi:TPA: hypothetical protein HA251_03900 [Candidatus Woesearchaeota archaeon]|nr:hypothetical protein [Candidatus Woesearchaeota archaeon]
MNGKIMLVAIALTACMGVYLFGDGITGLMVAESCCFGSDCPVDRLCDAAEPHIESPMPIVNTLWGAVILLGVAGAFYVIYHVRRQ